MMRIALVCTPPTERHLKWAAQVGATDFVSRYAAVSTPEKMRDECARVAKFGLQLSVVEGYIPLDDVIRGGENRDAQIENAQQLIAAMGQNGVEILCYNWMPNNDWTRTAFAVPTRGGALTNEFHLRDLQNENVPGAQNIGARELWENLEYFLRAVLPVAEKANVKLAMHPDDPPLRELSGSAQIMHEPENFERLFGMLPSPHNGMCLCGGTFSSLGKNVAELVRRFHSHIHYAHFRDVRGTVPHFVETFHDSGQQNMAEVMRAYRDIGFAGPMRPDHVPQMDGETGPADGYSMLGRLFAVGYLRGLMHAVESE
jgi:mannonate dehydratase